MRHRALTRQLAEHFHKVIGIDPSEDQIANAQGPSNVDYLRAPAEQLPLPDASASLITAAQAAHWFDRPRFYAEVRRVADDGAIIALLSYGVMRLAPSDLQDRFDRFYSDEIGPYWPPERKLVDSGYADIEFPFEEMPYPDDDRSCLGAWRIPGLPVDLVRRPARERGRAR